ncbi:DUF2809 domain-containing protein [Polyangium sp. y55x31]|uniref:ribosomal maturation YjgA family protein n=1 Tax=Polyangium sp. y55x31 TaxID=3042688 RepID=UPI002482448B|nr:DUF2809 domain-containing protein [Polyangium sp. y55x31]MDI1478720.1 DUF2809 domain-containing protein [Polyangium sp. y55x31]
MAEGSSRRTELRRSRVLYAALVVVTIGLGLLSRKIPGLPAWLSKGAGDALYATMSFWLAGLVAPASRTAQASIAALLFCYAVEASQLYHAPWIDAIRAMRLGGLALGHGFHAMDLIYYAVGVIVGIGIERAGRLRRERPS